MGLTAEERANLRQLIHNERKLRLKSAPKIMSPGRYNVRARGVVTSEQLLAQGFDEVKIPGVSIRGIRCLSCNKTSTITTNNAYRHEPTCFKYVGDGKVRKPKSVHEFIYTTDKHGTEMVQCPVCNYYTKKHSPWRHYKDCPSDLKGRKVAIESLDLLP